MCASEVHSKAVDYGPPATCMRMLSDAWILASDISQYQSLTSNHNHSEDNRRQIATERLKRLTKIEHSTHNMAKGLKKWNTKNCQSISILFSPIEIVYFSYMYRKNLNKIEKHWNFIFSTKLPGKKIIFWVICSFLKIYKSSWYVISIKRGTRSNWNKSFHIRLLGMESQKKSHKLCPSS